MKKQIQKKLRLSKETLRNLDPNQLADVEGGLTATCCNSCTNTCTQTCLTPCN